MADVGTPSAMAMSTSNAGAEASKDKAAPPSKPERPDEETYKNDLSKAEKDLRAAEDRMVSAFLFGYLHGGALGGIEQSSAIYGWRTLTDCLGRNKSRPNSTTHAPITKTLLQASASKNSAPSYSKSAPSNSQASLLAPP